MKSEIILNNKKNTYFALVGPLNFRISNNSYILACIDVRLFNERYIADRNAISLLVGTRVSSRFE